MKNAIFVTIGILFSATLGMVVSTHALSSGESIQERIFEEADVGPTYSDDTKELEKLAANDELPFNNLYLFMYQNVFDGPQKATFKELAKWTDYNKDDLEKIIVDGDLSSIITAKSIQKTVEEQEADLAAADAELNDFLAANDFSEETKSFIRAYYAKYAQPQIQDLNSALTQEAVKDEYTLLVNAYKEEFELQRDNRKLGYEALAGEMFLNNDLSDSANIDLLYDLDLLHYVIFGTYITYPDRSGGEPVILSSEDAGADEKEVILASDITSPYTCLNDDELSSAIDEFSTTPPAADEGGFHLPSFGIEIKFPWRSDSGEREDSASGDSVKAVQDSLEELGTMISQLEGNKGDWTRSLPCGEVFCITVDLVTSSEDPAEARDYEKTDNCVLCHITYINKLMEETLSKSLVPGKLSMNFFEDATCKEGGYFVNLDFNIYTVKKPIKLDPGTGIEDQAAKDVEALKTKLFTVAGFPLPGGSDTSFKKTIAGMACESILNLYEIADATGSLDEARAKCQTAANEAAKSEDAAYEEFVFDASNQNQNMLYSQVSAELYTMLSYFEGFSQALQETYLNNDSPLKGLINKIYCGT